jgi:hypothetical protein
MLIASYEGSTSNSGSSIYDFSEQSTLDNWNLINDVVMGGQSISAFSLNEHGNGLFRGKVSLENNGGFASLRYRFDKPDVQAYNSIAIRLKGDGLRYQFRVKSQKNDRQSYVYHFQTSGDWEWIEIPLAEMYPTWRGRTLRMANYPGQSMEEIAFLIANNKPEEFHLEIDQIVLK